ALEGLEPPRLGAERLVEFQEPAAFRDLRSMGPHRGQLLVDELADVEPGGYAVVRNGEGRRLAVGRETVFHAGPLHRLGHLPHQRFWERGIVQLARAEWVATGKSLDVASVKKGADRDAMGLDVVGVGVATKFVLRDHDLRA